MVWETVRMLRLDPDRIKRKIQYQLLAINLIIIILDHTEACHLDLFHDIVGFGPQGGVVGHVGTVGEGGTIGWWSMVTGQSIVLYSRLHLVVSNQRVLRRVLIMISLV
jgi:hypothetical protein